MKTIALIAALSFLSSGLLCGQGSYEVQVYGSPLTDPGITMVELHSNFTFEGSKVTDDGTYPTEHQLHETVEITHGFNNWFETGFYVFMNRDPRSGLQWVGDHIRPRISVPKSYNLPVGLSLSSEIGYQRAVFSPDTWTAELRPVIDATIGDLYLCFNPTVTRAFHGPSISSGVVFSPNVKLGYALNPRVNVGLEYYGSLGPVTGFDRIRNQQEQVFGALDLFLSPNWEFNVGVGVGMTSATDHLLVKMILGRRFTWGKRK